MSLSGKRKALLDVDLSTWAQVKHLATVRNISVNEAVKFLLEIGLCKHGYKPIAEVTLESDLKDK